MRVNSRDEIARSHAAYTFKFCMMQPVQSFCTVSGHAVRGMLLGVEVPHSFFADPDPEYKKNHLGPYAHNAHSCKIKHKEKS